MRIAILEDDPNQSLLFQRLLGMGGYEFESFDSIQALMLGLQLGDYGLLLLDWRLPDGTGEDVIRMLRGSLRSEMPVIVVTANDDERDVVRALNAGADDYVVKPPRAMALLARVQAVLRRVRGEQGVSSGRIGRFAIDVEGRDITCEGRPVRLTQKEFDLAFHLFAALGRTVSRKQLLEQVWNNEPGSSTRTLDTHISRLRRKLGLESEAELRLVSVYGFGYRLEKAESGARLDRRMAGVRSDEDLLAA
ncbi:MULTISPECIES: response regulator transcription factor [Ramlibacter]|uniref:Response regulator transcription factor n=1 Tax=Ramlibacter aquaticus TaxID=2780094 RepID=A0ABR9SG11_9BURK|nr:MULTISPECIES: response regulator transcription factor [Ramlibacter]MBE7941289.1 response regulator transcription factor [Ramlibacter aquaticus]